MRNTLKNPLAAMRTKRERVLVAAGVYAATGLDASNLSAAERKLARQIANFVTGLDAAQKKLGAQMVKKSRRRSALAQVVP